MNQYFTKPKKRFSDDLHEFDVTRLSGWSAIRIYSYLIVFSLLSIGLTQNIEILQKWGDWVERIIWGLLILIPLLAFLVYYFARKRSTVLDFADYFPRYHTLEHYRGIVLGAGVFAIAMSIVPFILGKEAKGHDSGYVGLILILALTTTLFWYICRQSKTEVPKEIESARRCSWTPEAEEELELRLKRELQELDEKMEIMVENRGSHPCGNCNGKGVIAEWKESDEDSNAVSKEGSETVSEEGAPPILEETVCEECTGTGMLEWISNAQKQGYDNAKRQRDRCVAELRKLDDSGDWRQMSLEEVRFPWFTEHGHPNGDPVPELHFQASANGLGTFQDKNKELFTEWQSVLEDKDAADTYNDNIGSWGKTYVSHKIHAAESREVKTLSYHLYQVVRNNSLSELQQIELCLAAVQSLVKQREDIPPPELDVFVKPDEAAADLPKLDRVKAVATTLWEVVGFWRDPMSKTEEDSLWESIKKWHINIQRTDDDDEDGEIEEIVNYVGKLEEWFKENKPESEWPGGEYKQIATECLTPKEHAALLRNLEQLNDINIEKNTEKHNHFSIRISDLRHAFDKFNKLRSGTSTFHPNHYPKFPTETLIQMEGTVDDGAILLAALLHDCGYKVRLYRSTYTDIEKGEIDRMGVAVEIEGSKDTRLVEPSRVHKGMVYCEATPKRWHCNDLDITEKRPRGIDINPPKIKEEPSFQF